jgi:hypothetical protein
MIIIDVPFSAKQAENLKETKEQILKELETIEKFGADETQYFVDRNELEESSTVVEIKNLFNSIIDNSSHSWVNQLNVKTNNTRRFRRSSMDV